MTALTRTSPIFRLRAPLAGAAVVAGLLAGVPVAAAETTRPAACVPFGTAQLPPGVPSQGGDIGFERLPEFVGDNAPSSVELRTQTTQFNRFWDFALVDSALLARPRGGSDAEPWRYAPLPECLRDSLVGISVDDDELIAVDDAGWIYTMDNASQSPLFWNWTSAFGAPLWTGSGQRLPGSAPGTWALSVSSPWDNQTYIDAAGRVQHVGLAKMTMVPALTGDGSRITYADPWLPNDQSYEIGGPLGGRFQSIALSSAGSTTFVVNEYGDMFTRHFDFDSSGSDSVFFRYSWDDQSDRATAPNMLAGMLDRSTAAIQLPAQDWARQPKIPGEITSAISVHSTGVGSDARELRVAGRQDGESGFWHKDLNADAWQFTATGAELPGVPLENSPFDRSSETLAPPAPWNLSASLPSRDTLVDGQFLIDVGLPYSVVDPRLLDAVGGQADPSGYRIAVSHFDPAATTREATVTAPDGAVMPVLLHTADGLRFEARGPGLDEQPRHLVGAIEIPQSAFEARSADPALDAFVREWMRGKQIAPITLSATDTDLVVR
ncbi:Secreted protein [Prescottella defluvii]